SPALLIVFAATLALAVVAGCAGGWRMGLAVLVVLIGIQTVAALVVALRRKAAPAAPLSLAGPLAVLVGVLAMLAGCFVRLVAVWQKGLVEYAWPVLSVGQAFQFDFGAAPLAGAGAMQTSAEWLVECAGEFVVVALLTRYA